MHLIVLLSALLASLTGLVSGERPAEPTRIEHSAFAAIVQPCKPVAQTAARPANVLPRLAMLRAAPEPAADHSAPARSGRALLSVKQSWLH